MVYLLTWQSGARASLGIRKVLGASGFQLVYLLSATFTRPILIATAIAVPLAWYGMSQWLTRLRLSYYDRLDDFRYRVSVGTYYCLADREL